MEPRGLPGASFMKSEGMGTIRLERGAFAGLMRKMSLEWPGNSYDVLKKNCCHFCNELCQRLGVGPIPEWITNLAGMGARISDHCEVGAQAVAALDNAAGQVRMQVTAKVLELDQRAAISWQRILCCDKNKARPPEKVVWLP